MPHRNAFTRCRKCRSSDPGINDGLTCAWEFGDGSGVVTGTLVSHVYGDNGEYAARLRVTDDSGVTGTDGVTGTIVNANPVADAGAGDLLTLSGSASDPGVGDALQVAWDLDYDGVNFDKDVVGSTSVEWRYGDGPARYVVAYRVLDDDYPYAVAGVGEIGEAIDTLEVVVDNVLPVAEAGGPYASREGETTDQDGQCPTSGSRRELTR